MLASSSSDPFLLFFFFRLLALLDSGDKLSPYSAAFRAECAADLLLLKRLFYLVELCGLMMAADVL